MTPPLSTAQLTAPVPAGAPTFKPRARWTVLLNLLLPGLGYLYAGRPRRAAVALVALYSWIVLLLLLSFVAPWPALRVSLLLLMLGGPVLLLPLDGARVARSTGHAPRRWYQRWFALSGVWFAGALLVQAHALDWIKAHVAEAFRIPSGSMEPTILTGDLLFASPRVTFPVERGAIVIYHVDGDDRRYTHRAVAIPGDTAAMRNFQLTVNGRVAQWPTGVVGDGVAASTSDEAFAWQHSRLAPGVDSALYRPSYGTWGPLVLRADEYFVIGDDTDNSLDSRYRGPVHSGSLAGHPEWVYFSRDPESGQVRWSRIGRAVR